MCVCVCVCVFVGACVEGSVGKEKEEKEEGWVCVCVFVCRDACG